MYNSLLNSNFNLKKIIIGIFVIQNMLNYNRFHVSCFLKVTCNVLISKKEIKIWLIDLWYRIETGPKTFVRKDNEQVIIRDFTVEKQYSLWWFYNKETSPFMRILQ